MTEQLKAAIAAAEKLPPRLQDVIAADILNSIGDEEKWQAIFNDPLFAESAQALFEEYQQQKAAGETSLPMPTT